MLPARNRRDYDDIPEIARREIHPLADHFVGAVQHRAAVMHHRARTDGSGRGEILRAVGIAGTEGASYPFWSSDSRSVAYFASGQLRRVDASLCRCPNDLCDSVARAGTATSSSLSTKSTEQYCKNGAIHRLTHNVRKNCS